MENTKKPLITPVGEWDWGNTDPRLRSNILGAFAAAQQICESMNDPNSITARQYRAGKLGDTKGFDWYIPSEAS